HRLGPGRRAQVERDRLLVAVDGEVVRGQAGAGVVRRAPAARHVAVLGMLDLDHAGAEVAEHHRAEGAGEDAREVEDEHALERRAHREARGAGRQPRGPGRKWNSPSGMTSTSSTRFAIAQYWFALHMKSAGGSSTNIRETWR